MGKIPLSLLCCLCAVIILTQPALADLMLPRITHVYFENDGVPLNTSVRYTVKCSGYLKLNETGYLKTPAPGQSYIPGIVFSYSATCPSYGCEIYEPYYHMERAHIDWYDIYGETRNSTFSIRNFSDHAYSRCTDVPVPVIEEADKTYSDYYLTPEFAACKADDYLANRSNSSWWTTSYRAFLSCNLDKEPGCFSLFAGINSVKENISNRTSSATSSWTGMKKEDFMLYLETCDPRTDPWCGGWTIDGIPVKKIPGLRPFTDVKSPKGDICDTFLIRASPSVIVPQNMTTTRWVPNGNLAMDLCELRVQLPQDNQTPSRSYSQDQYIPKSPVESLYCSILQFLGGRCE